MRTGLLALGAFAFGAFAAPAFAQEQSGLWQAYNDIFRSAKYIDLTHAFEPNQPVWPGFGQAKFKPSVAGNKIEGYVDVGDEFTYEKHGFVATAYEIPTDQYGTQLDPPAHWEPMGATICDIPATYAIRPLVVINIADKVVADEGYHLQVADIEAWEAEHGTIPEGAVVMVRSDWHKKWADIARFNQKPFPGVSLDALKFLHNRAEHPLPRPRAARHRHDADSGGRVLADAQSLRPGRRRRQSRPGAGSRAR